MCTTSQMYFPAPSLYVENRSFLVVGTVLIGSLNLQKLTIFGTKELLNIQNSEEMTLLQNLISTAFYSHCKRGIIEKL